MTPPPGSIEEIQWRMGRLEQDFDDFRRELRDQRYMPREDVLDRLTLVANTAANAINAVERNAQEREQNGRARMDKMEAAVNRLIFAVLGALITASIGLLETVLRLLSPHVGGG